MKFNIIKLSMVKLDVIKKAMFRTEKHLFDFDSNTAFTTRKSLIECFAVSVSKYL